MTSGFKQTSINGGTVPVYDIGDTFVTNSYMISAYHNMVPGIKTPQVFGSGFNTSGQLGIGSLLTKSSPVQVGSLTNWKYIACGANGNVGFTAAVKTDGTLWNWGDNGQGQLGQGNTTRQSSPVAVGALTTYKQIACGYGHIMAIKTDGTMWGCGYNSGAAGGAGALGDGTIISKNSPVQVVGGGAPWKQVACGYGHTIAIRTDGTLWSTGINLQGQLGKGDTTTRSTPTQIGTLTTWKMAAAGGADSSTSCSGGISGDGTLWLWGQGTSGQLGSGSVAMSSPIQVAGNWKYLSIGGSHVAAIKPDGTLWVWGSNSSGELGLSGNAIPFNPGTNRSSPVQVGTSANWKYVACGLQFTVAIKTDGTLWGWGAGTLGEMSQNNLLSLSSPVQVGTSTNWKQIAAASGGFHWMAISEGGGW